MIDKYLFPPTASINTTAFDFKAMLNAKKDKEFSPNDKIRKVWIPKQCLIYKNDLATKMKVSAARENRKKWKISIPSI